MEKRRPHLPPRLVTLCTENDANVRITRSAYDGAAELGLTRADILTVVRNLTQSVFYKSMTAYDDHTTWQDVYRPCYHGIPLYVKLTLIETENLLIVSFKRR